MMQMTIEKRKTSGQMHFNNVNIQKLDNLK